MRRVFLISVLMLLVSGGVWGQEAGPSVTPYGNGLEPTLHYANEQSPANEFRLSVGDTTGYNDNVLSSDVSRTGDFFTDVGAHLTYTRQQKRTRVDFEYDPSFDVFKKYSQYDSVNQSLGFDVSHIFGPHFSAEFRENGSEFTYGHLSSLVSTSVGGSGSPTGLVQGLYTPRSVQITNGGMLDLVYHKSKRTSLDFFGGYFLRTFSRVQVPSASLYDVNEYSAGAQFSYRASARSTLGLSYLFQNMAFGSTSRNFVHRVAASYVYMVSPRTAIQVWGGPENTQSHQTIIFTLFGIFQIPLPVRLKEWDWSAGGSVTTERDRTIFSLSAGRTVNDGGGLLQAVNYNSVMLSISRRLYDRWEGRMNLNYNLIQSLGFHGLQSSQADTEDAGVSLSRAISERLRLSMTYNYGRQRGATAALRIANLDRNVASVGLYYDVGRLRLGR